MGALDFNVTRRAAPPAADRLVAMLADAGSEEVVNNLLLDQGIANAYVARGTLDDAIELMRNAARAPRHLLVDVSASAMPVSDLMRLAEVVDPSVTVVVVGERNDVGLYRSLLRIGVHDYLVKPLTVELVQRALASTDPSAAARTGKALGFVGARGGVGVTSIATALARHLADKTRRRIVYVDLDLYGGAAASMLGVTSNNGLTELLQNTQRLDQQLINQAVVAQSDRLFVLSAELPYDNDFTVRPGTVGELVAALKHHFHYVVLDLPQRAGAVADEALDACAMVHVVADRSVHAAREATRLCRFAEGRPADPAISVLLNEAQAPVRGRVASGDFTHALARASIHPFPYEPEALALAENLGEPIADSRSRFAQAVVSLADAVTGGDTVAAPTARWYEKLLPARRKP
ncbi:AAA family ATPase [Trinickia caryophylli]|uniref:Pilus assembly protein CpaE n=1 Tax=Trinickia caryophylli TaxID=28094 RepID=A0A1X7EYK9_TRICW|nr:AAA family ATPase [Trinickia caryophylli]PMS09655.1 fimbrial protein [Trinickia caryophylli]TRX18422.1 AAA family ATPase [Trinickia caryophylli]WQE10791.1 AAA family ATPase [Trinickia caryophylli]SMF42182.1 pilus assembly protein CpaE [Trinickia caryophylli]GLU33170.1 fimbriae assembly protein [Trinickia caryophylli]